MKLNFKEKLQEPKFFKVITELGKKENINVYAVGGYVRDLILGREIKEIDFLVVGDGLKFASMLADNLGVENINLFKNFGTAHFRYKKLDLEFVGARKESYAAGSRNPQVSTGTFEQDISRRDFTINSLALSINNDNFGEVIDLYNGLEDIEKGIIRTPLDPLQTFNDDPLRILRAFRFACQLNFEVDEETKRAAGLAAERLIIVSQERKTDEFLKILGSKKPSVGLKLLQENNVMEYIFPEIANLSGVDQRKDYHHKDVFLHTCQVVDNISEVSDDLWLRFAALVHDIAKPQTKKFIEGTGWTFHGHEDLGARMMGRIFKNLKLPLTKIEYVKKLVKLHLRPIALVSEDVTDSAIRRLSANAGEDLDDLISLCRADITSKNPAKVAKYLNNYDVVMKKVKDVQERDNLRNFQSPVDGIEIMELFNLEPSKKVGVIKKAIEEAILDGIIPNTHEDALNYIIERKKEFINN